MTFRVTSAERDLIRKALKLTGMKNLRAYLLKQAVNGRIIHVELDSVREMNRLNGNGAVSAVSEPGVWGPDCVKTICHQQAVK
jgi:hypothetical protein